MSKGWITAKGWNTAKCGHIVDLKHQPCQACEPDKWKVFMEKYYLRRGVA